MLVSDGIGLDPAVASVRLAGIWRRRGVSTAAQARRWIKDNSAEDRITLLLEVALALTSFETLAKSISERTNDDVSDPAR